MPAQALRYVEALIVVETLDEQIMRVYIHTVPKASVRALSFQWSRYDCGTGQQAWPLSAQMQALCVQLC